MKIIFIFFYLKKYVVMLFSIRDVIKKLMLDGELSLWSLREGVKNLKLFCYLILVIGNIILILYIFYKWDLKLLVIKK